MQSGQRKFLILLADDSEDDRFFTKRTLSPHSHLVICGETTDGEETILYLEGKENFSDRTRHPFPDLILLDLKLLKRSGYEVLEWIKKSTFHQLPVFVVSGSGLDGDRDRCLQLGAQAFCTKALGPKQKSSLVVEIDKWIESTFKLSQ